MKLILAIPAAGLLFSGALGLKNVTPTGLSACASASVASVSEKPSAKMWADNISLFKGETLRLHFTPPHGAYLGVIDPDGHFFYVVFPAEQSEGKLTPFVCSERFVSLDELLIPTSTFKADPYTDGVMENKRVFTKSGIYRFLLGDNLHTDDTRFLDVVKVRYRHKPRPEQAVAAYAAK